MVHENSTLRPASRRYAAVPCVCHLSSLPQLIHAFFMNYSELGRYIYIYFVCLLLCITLRNAAQWEPTISVSSPLSQSASGRSRVVCGGDINGNSPPHPVTHTYIAYFIVVFHFPVDMPKSLPHPENSHVRCEREYIIQSLVHISRQQWHAADGIWHRHRWNTHTNAHTHVVRIIMNCTVYEMYVLCVPKA